MIKTARIATAREASIRPSTTPPEGPVAAGVASGVGEGSGAARPGRAKLEDRAALTQRGEDPQTMKTAIGIGGAASGPIRLCY